MASSANDLLSLGSSSPGVKLPGDYFDGDVDKDTSNIQEPEACVSDQVGAFDMQPTSVLAVLLKIENKHIKPWSFTV